MGLVSYFSNVWSALSGRAGGAPQGSNLGSGWTGGPAFSDAFSSRPSPTPPRLVQAYKSIIYFCVELNAKHVSKVPLRLYAASGPRNRPRSFCEPRQISRRMQAHIRELPYLQRSAATADQLDEVTRHPFLDLLDRPDPLGYFTRRGLVGLWCRYLDVVGAAYAKPFGVLDRFPEELWPLQSQYVLPVNQGMSALIDHYTYFTETYQFDELLRFKFDSLTNPYAAGYSPTQAAIEYARLEDQFVSIQESILGAGPRPGMIISPSDPKMPLGDPEAKRLEMDLNRKFSRGAAARVWVQRQPLNAQVVTYPPADLGQIGISEYDLQRTVSCFGQHPAQYTTETNLANMEATHRFHAENGIEPRCYIIAEQLTRLVQKYDERLFVAFDPVLREDLKQRADIHKIYLDAAVICPAEVRTEINFNDEPAWNVDEPYIDGTKKQPSAAEADRENAAKVAAAGVVKPGAKPEKTDDEKRAWDQIHRVLDRMEWTLEDRALADGDGHSHHGNGATPRHAAQGIAGRGEYLRPARGRGPGGGAPALVSAATGGGRGGHTGNGVAREVSPAGGLRQRDVVGHDADAGRLLGGQWEGDDDPAGPGPGDVEGAQPTPPREDPDGGPELLPEHEPDDQ